MISVDSICVQALKSFSRAVHINPEDADLREDDLNWAAELVHRKAQFDRAAVEAASSSDITELDADSTSIDSDNQLTSQHSNLPNKPFNVGLNELPLSYVAMRD